MELRDKKTVSSAVVALLWLAPALFGQTYSYQVRHEHLYKGCVGTLEVDTQGVRYTQTGKAKHPHQWEWQWQDIQKFTLAPDTIEITSYKDDVWLLGADRGFEFRALAGHPFTEVYAFLRDRLDQRLVAELALPADRPLWQIPVKRLGRIEGSEGVLSVSLDAMTYASTKTSQSMTWRYKDIENIRTSDIFHLTLTSLYGSVEFQLKEALGEDRYDELWRRINREKGLKFLAEAAGE